MKHWCWFNPSIHPSYPLMNESGSHVAQTGGLNEGTIGIHIPGFMWNWKTEPSMLSKKSTK